jgi:hypothetical protein
MIQRFENSGALHRHDRIFKPAVLRHFRAAAHIPRLDNRYRDANARTLRGEITQSA